MAIVDHKHEYIFIKSRKTGSSSVEASLGRFAGEEAILAVQKEVSKSLSGTKSTRSATEGHGAYVDDIFVDPHIHASDLKDILHPNVWENYYKITFERNPFDRLVSFYEWRCRGGGDRPSFREFALAALSNDKERRVALNAGGFSNRPFYMIDGRLAVDQVGLYENLLDEIWLFSEHVGLPFDGWLPRLKSKFRGGGAYKEYYDREVRRAVEDACALELDMFGYQF